MKTIWKFPIRVVDSQVVEMPFDAKILCVQVQQGAPCLWALVDTEAIKSSRRIYIYGTGKPIPDNIDMKYIGTFQYLGGSLVWHVFERSYDD